MKRISEYILEKLHLDKDISINDKVSDLQEIFEYILVCSDKLISGIPSYSNNIKQAVKLTMSNQTYGIKFEFKKDMANLEDLANMIMVEVKKKFKYDIEKLKIQMHNKDTFYIITDFDNVLTEKLHLNKNFTPNYSPEEGDKVMTINFLTGNIDCVVKTAIVKSTFRNTVVLKYTSESIGVDTMFELTEKGEDYFGKSESGDLVFDKETALKLIDKCNDNYIYPKCNMVVSPDNRDEYLKEIKKQLEDD
jgi:hypothetical protein